VAVKAVVFDFGYTLVNEDRVWNEIARANGWPVSDFYATLGALIERRQHHRVVFERLGAGAVDAPPFESGDFYDDALPCIRAAKRSGARVGIAGNTSLAIEDFLSEHVDVDFLASSARWGVEKPNPEFFTRVVEASGCAARDVTYVGDRIDNDVVPAAAAGMRAVFLVRGPWAAVQKDWPEASAARTVVRDLQSLPL
jgi:FMN phosphatase YigB (HAD superfamily)